jgi:hypothetical protein
VIGSIEQAMARLGVTSDTLSPGEKSALDTDGCVVLRSVYSEDQCAALIETFERRYVPSHLSLPPRHKDSRHAMLNDEPLACRACLAPQLLASAHHLLQRRFFLFDVQGRDPLPGGGGQRIHRDWVEPGPAPTVLALAFLEPFGPANGATRVLPGSHRPGPCEEVAQGGEVPGQVVIEGKAGDVLVMHGSLAHSGTRNGSADTRRNLQIGLHGYETFDPRSEKRDLTPYTPEERYLLGGEA